MEMEEEGNLSSKTALVPFQHRKSILLKKEEQIQLEKDQDSLLLKVLVPKIQQI
jgi:hypothetical protein